MDDAIEFEPVVTVRPGAFDPKPPEFVCAICERAVFKSHWHNDNRTRSFAPICLNCEQCYGTTNLSSMPGFRMDARIIRQVGATAAFLNCLSHRVKQFPRSSRRGA